MLPSEVIIYARSVFERAGQRCLPAVPGKLSSRQRPAISGDEFRRPSGQTFADEKDLPATAVLERRSPSLRAVVLVLRTEFDPGQLSCFATPSRGAAPSGTGSRHAFGTIVLFFGFRAGHYNLDESGNRKRHDPRGLQMDRRNRSMLGRRRWWGRQLRRLRRWGRWWCLLRQHVHDAAGGWGV